MLENYFFFLWSGHQFWETFCSISFPVSFQLCAPHECLGKLSFRHLNFPLHQSKYIYIKDKLPLKFAAFMSFFFFHLTRILSLEKSALEHSSSCKVMKCSAQGKLGQEINIVCFNGHLQHVHTKFLFYLLGYYTEYFFTAHRRMQTNPICYNCSVNLQVASAGRVPVRHTETL